MKIARHMLVGLLLIVDGVSSASAQTPELQGDLRVDPPQLQLVHRRWPHSLLITGRTALGQTVDLRRDARIASANDKTARAAAGGWIEPGASGGTDLKS